MIKATVEYVGFRTGAGRREYLLRSHLGPEVHEYTVGIALAAFAAGRVRLQDGPEICYLKILRELESTDVGAARQADLTVTDAELADYVTAHTTPARGRSGFSASAATATPPARTPSSEPRRD
jgi:hypothetical protein